MIDLETRLAEARERLSCADYREGCKCTDCILRHQGFDAAAAIAREVVAEKDAEIARLKYALGLAKNSEVGLQRILDSSLELKDEEIARLTKELRIATGDF